MDDINADVLIYFVFILNPDNRNKTNLPTSDAFASCLPQHLNNHQRAVTSFKTMMSEDELKDHLDHDFIDEIEKINLFFEDKKITLYDYYIQDALQFNSYFKMQKKPKLHLLKDGKYLKHLVVNRKHLHDTDEKNIIKNIRRAIKQSINPEIDKRIATYNKQWSKSFVDEIITHLKTLDADKKISDETIAGLTDFLVYEQEQKGGGRQFKSLFGGKRTAYEETVFGDEFDIAQMEQQVLRLIEDGTIALSDKDIFCLSQPLSRKKTQKGGACESGSNTLCNVTLYFVNKCIDDLNLVNTIGKIICFFCISCLTQQQVIYESEIKYLTQLYQQTQYTDNQKINILIFGILIADRAVEFFRGFIHVYNEKINELIRSYTKIDPTQWTAEEIKICQDGELRPYKTIIKFEKYHKLPLNYFTQKIVDLL